MTPETRATAGTVGDGWRATRARHAWQPDLPEHGRRLTCRECGGERWAHEIPTPREATR